MRIGYALQLFSWSRLRLPKREMTDLSLTESRPPESIGRSRPLYGVATEASQTQVGQSTAPPPKINDNRNPRCARNSR